MERHDLNNRGCDASDFDGHLEWTAERMSTEQRLEWIWQMMLFRQWAREHVILEPPGGGGGHAEAVH